MPIPSEKGAAAAMANDERRGREESEGRREGNARRDDGERPKSRRGDRCPVCLCLPRLQSGRFHASQAPSILVSTASEHIATCVRPS